MHDRIIEPHYKASFPDPRARRSATDALRSQDEKFRLFRHDGLIARNTLRATFANWHDRAIALLMLFAALAGIRFWVADRPWATAAWAALAAGIMIGIGVGRIVAARLSFHAFDGLLAADALHPRTRQHYTAAWHGVGLALLALASLIARPSPLVVSAPAYLAGALAAGLADGLRMPRQVARTTRPVWTIRRWLNSPIVGLGAATILLLSLLAARTLDTNALITLAGIETVLLALMLTTVDDDVVRFMTIAGHGSRRIIVQHAKGIASLLAVAMPGSWVMLGPVTAGIIAGACAAMLLLLTLRIVAYRLHGKRLADVIVSILVGLLMLVAYSIPPALPVVALAMLWQLQRQGRAKTWLLA